MIKLDTKIKHLLRDPHNNYAKRHAWVIYQLKLQGRSLASVARDAGVCKQQPQKALDMPYPRMEKFIADALGLTPQELFPERYDTNGLPNRIMGRRKKFKAKTPKNNTPDSRGNAHERKVA